MLFAGLVVLVESLYLTALSPLLPDLERDLGLSDLWLGLVVAGYPLGVVVATLPAAMIADRRGVRGITTLGLLLLGVATVVFAVAESPTVAFVARVIQGLGSAGAWSGAMTWVVAASPVSHRGRTIGFVMAFTLGGALVGPVLGGAASALGREPVFLAAGVLSLALALVSLRVAPPPHVPPQGLAVLGRVLRSRDVLAAMGLIALVALVAGVSWTLVPTDMDRSGWSALAISVTFVAASAFEMVAGPLAGRWYDHEGERRPLIAGLTATIALLTVLSFGFDGWSLPISMTLIGLAFGLLMTPSLAMLSRRREQRGLGDALGIVTINLSFAPGFAVGPVLAGVAAETVGRDAAYLVVVAVALVALIAVARAAVPVRATDDA